MGDKKKTALVTGASSGIGRETAVRLCEAGFEVVTAARRLDRLEEMAAQHAGMVPMRVDLSDEEDTERFCKEISKRPGGFSVLVNNAGYSIRGVVEDVPLDAVRRLFEVNLFALIRVTQACLPGMRKSRAGTIVNLSSIVGRFCFPGSGVYAASKYAVEGITDAMRLEGAPFGIRVTAVRPGPIATEFNDVATEMTGDLMARADPDYKTFYQTAGSALGKLFENLSLPGPDKIADLILEAVFSDNPKTAYEYNPLAEDFLGRRHELDDEDFYRFMLEKFGLKGIRF